MSERAKPAKAASKRGTDSHANQAETATESQPGGPPPLDGPLPVQGVPLPEDGKVEDGVPYAVGVGSGLSEDSDRKVTIKLSNHLPLDADDKPAGLTSAPVVRHAIPGEELELSVPDAYSVINAGYSTVDSEDPEAVRQALGLK